MILIKKELHLGFYFIIIKQEVITKQKKAIWEVTTVILQMDIQNYYYYY